MYALPVGFPALGSDILPIPVNYPDGDSDFALQPGVPAQPVPRAVGRRHENADLNARMLITPEEPFMKEALTAAQEQYESLSVTAAHDLMVLSVERRQDESAPAELEAYASPEASSSTQMHPALAEPVAASAVAEEVVKGLQPSAAQPARVQRSRAKERPPAIELEWDPLPEPQEAKV